MSSGASPFANGREAPQARNRSGDTPSSLKTILRNKLIYNFTKDYATIFIVDAIAQDIAKKRTHFAI